MPRPRLLLIALFALSATGLWAVDFEPAASATNQLGLDLFRQFADARTAGNLLLSPYSIESALAMTCAGAAGETHAELAHTLYFGNDDAAMHASFRALREALAGVDKRIELHVANRLFGQDGYGFRDEFLKSVQASYGAEIEALDFQHHAEQGRATINALVEGQTRNRLRNVLPPGALDDRTRLVLVNALYFKAPWAERFAKTATGNLPFRLPRAVVDVPTMMTRRHFGYAKGDGFSAVSLPYAGEDLHFLVLLPDAPNGLATLAGKVTQEMLKTCATLEERGVTIYLPKFKLEPDSIPLGAALRALGIKAAFDPAAADFSPIAAPGPDGPLVLKEVYHKTFLALDEENTEAAAATDLTAGGLGPAPRPKVPVVVRVDHPFLFAIQHRASGTCLFLGRVIDPR